MVYTTTRSIVTVLHASPPSVRELRQARRDAGRPRPALRPRVHVLHERLHRPRLPTAARAPVVQPVWIERRCVHAVPPDLLNHHVRPDLVDESVHRAARVFAVRTVRAAPALEVLNRAEHA